MNLFRKEWSILRPIVGKMGKSCVCVCGFVCVCVWICVVVCVCVWICGLHVCIACVVVVFYYSPNGINSLQEFLFV